jgi:hypothetical protein
MDSIYDDKVLQDAMSNFGRAEQLCKSEEMKLLCNGLASLAFSLNELKKRVQFIEEKVGVSPLRELEVLLGTQATRE